MDPIKIIQQYYKTESKIYKILVAHSKAVAKRALEIASNVPELEPDLKFIREGMILVFWRQAISCAWLFG